MRVIIESRGATSPKPSALLKKKSARPISNVRVKRLCVFIIAYHVEKVNSNFYDISLWLFNNLVPLPSPSNKKKSDNICHSLNVPLQCLAVPSYAPPILALPCQTKPGNAVPRPATSKHNITLPGLIVNISYCETLRDSPCKELSDRSAIHFQGVRMFCGVCLVKRLSQERCIVGNDDQRAPLLHLILFSIL